MNPILRLSDRRLFYVFLFLLLALAVMQSGHAANASQGLPWEGPLVTLRKSLTGPFAYSIALIGIVVSMGMLMFGGELSTWAKSVLYIVLVISVLIGAQGLLSVIGGEGAVIASLNAIEATAHTLRV